MTQSRLVTTDRARLAISATLLALSLAGTSACASAESDSGSSGDGAGETITVEHAQGKTEVPVKPERIVSLDQTWSDALGELDVDLAMAMHAKQLDSGGPWASWKAEQEVTYDGLSASNTTADHLEEISAAEPDLILAGYLPDEKTYDRLSEIAPTVGVIGDGVVNDWRETTKIAGEIVAQKDQAEELVSDVEAQITKTREDHPGLKGATGVFGQVSANGLAAATDEADPANKFLSDLGIVIPDDIQAAGGDEGRAFISPEKIDLLNTDLMIMWPIDTDPTEITGWDKLSPVQNDTYVTADVVSATAMSTPTVTSVPWALEELAPVFTRIDDLRK